MSAFDSSDINQLIEESPFEPNTVERLEAFLSHQCSSKAYNFEANKVLMKNYQVHTKLVKVDMVTRILALALMQMPASDYLALSYMVPVSIVNNANVQYLAVISNLLERGQYKEFWVEFAKAPADLFEGINGVSDSIRVYIFNSVRDTFKNIPTSLFQEYLNLNDAEAKAYVANYSTICEVYIYEIALGYIGYVYAYIYTTNI